MIDDAVKAIEKTNEYEREIKNQEKKIDIFKKTNDDLQKKYDFLF